MGPLAMSARPMAKPLLINPLTDLRSQGEGRRAGRQRLPGRSP